MKPSAKAKQTILIVDDTPDNIMLISGLLKEKYNTKVATNGSTALQIAHTSPELDLILLDVMMPGLDGHETCRQLKADPVTADIPVIFLTAKSQIEDEASGLALGAVDYLTKPISPPILFARVAIQLNLRNAHQQLQDRLARMQQDAAMEPRRTHDYVQALARHPRFAPELGERQIALLAQLAAVAGAYGTLVGSAAAVSHEQALDIMRRGRGSDFDPDVLDAFLEVAAAGFP